MRGQVLDDGPAAPPAEPQPVRAGSRTLAVFGYSLNARVLRAHADGPLLSRELEGAIGWASQSSLRVAVARLCEIGALGRREVSGSSSGVLTELTEAGGQLLPVLDVLERWLALAPGGPLTLDDPAGRGIAKVLSAGWDSTVIRTLAERPLTLSELSAGIPAFSYPALKRRLAKLRATELVTPVDGDGEVASYVPSEWLRRAVAPLAVAASWEQAYDPHAEPVSRLEVEAAFLLTLPLVELPKRASGRCTLAVLLPSRAPAGRDLAGVTVEVERGVVVSCGLDGPPEPQEWALGTVRDWLEAVTRGRADALRIGASDRRLTHRIVRGLYVALDIRQK